MGQPLDVDDPRQVGPYRLEARLGQGATGVVFLGRARNGHPVAVKVIAPQLAADAGFRRWLAEELDALGRVRGAELPETVAADPAAEPPWVASPYVPGASLDEAVRTYGPLPPDAVRVLGASLAASLAALHGAGLVHTALRPHKVVLAAEGARLTPFAAARAVAAADPSRTVSAADGRFLAPEQARGYHVGPESDVFALAGLLVLAATGRPPFKDGPDAEVLRSTVEDQPELSAVPESLRSLLAAALAKDPEQRPDLEVLTRRLDPPPAKGADWLPPPLAARAVRPAGPRWPRRRTLLLAAGGAVVLGAAGTAAVLFSGSGDGSDDSTADKQKQSGAGVPETVGLTPRETIGLGKSTDTSSIAFSPDGKRLAITLRDRVSIWDVDSQRRLTQLTDDATQMATAVAYGRGGLLALGYSRAIDPDNLASDIGGITVWDTSASAPKRIAQITSPSEGKQLQVMNAVAFSPDGAFVVGVRNARDAIGKAQVWNVRSGKKVADLVIGKEKEDMSERGSRVAAARSLAFSPDGKLLAVGWGLDLAGGVTLFRTDGWKQAGELPLKDTDAFGVTSLAFTPDGRTLVGSFGGLALWDVPGMKLTSQIGDAERGIQRLALSPDGRTVAVNTASGVALHDLRTRKQNVAVESGRGGAGDLAFAPDGRTLAGKVTTEKLVTAVQLWTVE